MMTYDQRMGNTDLSWNWELSQIQHSILIVFWNEMKNIVGQNTEKWNSCE